VLNGAASFNTLGLAAGAHSVTAVYSGDASNLTSTSPALTQTINATALPPMKWLYGYDPLARPTIAVDPNQQTTLGAYDALGRLVQKQEPANVGTSSPTVIAYAYNAADDQTQVTDPRSLATTYLPNGVGDVKTQTSPDSGTTQYTYDTNGNVLSRTDARGKVTAYAYDALDRLTLVNYPTGVDTTLQYDGGVVPVQGSIGRLTKVTDESGQTVWAYNTLGQLSTKTQTTSSKVFAVGYGWGSAGGALDKVASITYPSGSRVNYAYDLYGRVSGITVNPVNANGAGVNTGSTVTLLSAVAYTPETKLKSWNWSDASARSISYNSFGQISGYSLGKPNGSGIAAGSQRTVVRDNAGRITGYTHTINAVSAPGLNQSFSYDNLGRLLSVTLGGVVTQYSYDATGNRKTKVVSGTTYTNTVATTSNRMTATQDVSGSFTVTHDNAGNITADGTNTFVYSDRGRMASATAAAGNTVSYLFTALDQRVAKTGPTAAVPTGAAYYVYGEDGQLLGEYDATQAPIYETIYLGSTPVGVMKRTGTAAGNNLALTVSNLFADHIDTPRVITRQSDQAIVWRWDSAESFGNSAPNQNPNALGTFVFNQRFPGQVFDAETGLAQNWFREYAARTGRFVQSDPIGLAGGINTFSYVGGNPVSYIDPLGLETCVLVTRMTAGLADHAALYFSRGSDSGGPAIYDPAGSYGRSIDPHTGDMITGKQADISKFTDFYKKLDGTSTDKTCKDTSKEEERRLFERALELGGQAGLSCARASSTVLSGSPYYRSVVPGTFFPGNLFRDAKKP
jgi:RHS repeat-associated protein